MRIDWAADVLRAEGLNVAEVDGWKTRGSADFDPKGIMAHHTAGATMGEAPSLNTVIYGRPGLPGPLSQAVLGRSGTIYMVASGRANHAGFGVWRSVSGNTHFIGIEAENSGLGQPWPDVQLRAYVAMCAAFCRKLELSSLMVCGHREYALPKGRKIDPAGIDMDEFRAAVSERLAGQALPLPVIPANVGASRPTLRRGAKGELVQLIQRAVGATVDGDFGPKTEAAVRHFQRLMSLVPDGIVGPKTWPLIEDVVGMKAAQDA